MSGAPPRPRRSLSQRGGPIVTRGEPELARVLSHALEASEHADVDDLTHGFHVYPARMHPVLARELIASFARPGEIVLDPFAGSGTVLVEAMVAGCRAQGVDLSPLAARVAEVHCALRDRPSRARFAAMAHAVCEASEARVRSRAAVNVPIPRPERVHYEPHVMLELSGLWEEISQVPEPSDRRALEMVFSALLVKFSRQRSDTNTEQVTKRIRKGLVTEFFGRKAVELELRWEALWESAAETALPARWISGDARRLRPLLGSRFRADLLLTSPPYGGTYDYASQHARRCAWLGLDMRALQAAEIGARRNLSTERGARARWDRELSEILQSARDVLHDEGTIVFWIGDAEIAETRIETDEQLARLAPDAKLVVVATASQERRDMRGGPPRREHLVVMRAAPAVARAPRGRPRK